MAINEIHVRGELVAEDDQRWLKNTDDAMDFVLETLTGPNLPEDGTQVIVSVASPTKAIPARRWAWQFEVSRLHGMPSLITYHPRGKPAHP